MRVKAKERGYDGIQLREVGEVFDIREFNLDKDGKPVKDEKGQPIPVFHADWMEKTNESPTVPSPQYIVGNPGAPQTDSTPKKT